MRAFRSLDPNKVDQEQEKMANNSSIVKFIVLLTLAFQIHASTLTPFQGEGSPICFTCFNIGEEHYESLLQRLHKLLEENTTKKVVEHTVLPEQTFPDEQPYTLMILYLFNLDEDNTSLAVRMDSLYVIGFANGSGHWHAFNGHEHLIPGSIATIYETDYERLIGGNMELPTIPLGKRSALEAMQDLSRYNPSTSNEEHMKLSLTKLHIMISEALRFIPIHETVSSGWESESFMKPEHAKMVPKWKDISDALLFWEKNGFWGAADVPILAQDYGITSEQAALQFVDFVVEPRAK